MTHPVLRAADSLGYRPNPIARGLKTNRLARDRYTPLIVNTDSDPERERRHIRAMLARRVDFAALLVLVAEASGLELVPEEVEVDDGLAPGLATPE